MEALAEYGDFEGAITEAFTGGAPALIGGASALGVAVAARTFAPAGSFMERHAGLLGGVGGVVVSIIAKKGGSATFAALLVGGAIEAMQYVTQMKMEA